MSPGIAATFVIPSTALSALAQSPLPSHTKSASPPDLVKNIPGIPIPGFGPQTAIGATSTPARKPTKEERQRLKREQEAAQRAAKGEKKKEEEAKANLPTQADMIEKCIAVRNIVFRPWRRGLFNPPASLSGVISNDCGRDAEVNISVTFYSASGDLMDLEHVSKLVPTGGALFWTSLSSDSDASLISKAAKVTGNWRLREPASTASS